MKQMKQTVKEKFNAFLARKGLKGTLQRNLILEAFLGLQRPVNIDELYLTLRSKHSNIGHATVWAWPARFISETVSPVSSRRGWVSAAITWSAATAAGSRNSTMPASKNDRWKWRAISASR